MGDLLLRLAILSGMVTMNSECIENSHWGNYFVFTFLDCYNGSNETDVDNIIVITNSDIYCNITIMFMETNETWQSSLAPFDEYKLHLNNTVTAFPFSGLLPRKAVVVMASTKVSVYGFCAHGSSVDGFLVIPAASLGYNYRTVSPETGGPQIAVVAVEDGSEVFVTFSGWNNKCFYGNGDEWMDINDGDDVVINMSAYDVINILCVSDTTGSLVESDKPIAVLSGSRAVSLPKQAYPNHVVEMLLPIGDYGNRFMIQAPVGTEYTAMVRVIINEDDTTLRLSPDQVTFHSGDYEDFVINEGEQFSFQATKPVLVVLFNRGKKSFVDEQYQGDAYMTVVPPVSKYGNYYVIPYSLFNNSTDKLTISIHQSNSLLPNDTVFQPARFGYLLASVTLPTQPHMDSKLYYSPNATGQFGVLVYGYGVKLGYGFPAGCNFTDTSNEEECLVSPCLNNGWCLETSLSFRCHCSDGFYTGPLCETELSTTTVSIATESSTTQTSTAELSTTESVSLADFTSSDISSTTTDGLSTDATTTTTSGPTTTNNGPTTTNNGPTTTSGTTTTNNGPTTTNNGPMTTKNEPTTTNNGPTTTNNGTTTKNNGPMTTNNGPTTTNNGLMTTNNGPMTTNNGSTTTNNGSTTTNNGPTTANNGPTTTNNGPTTTNSGPTTATSIPTTSKSDGVGTSTVLTSETTTQEASINKTTISPNASTNSILTYPETTNSTTQQPMPTRFRRIYFMCPCPCINRQNISKMLLQHNEEQRKNVLSKNNLSKTQRRKKSANNLTKFEQNLGFSALFIISCVCSLILIIDLVRFIDWVKGYIGRRKRDMEVPRL